MGCPVSLAPSGPGVVSSVATPGPAVIGAVIGALSRLKFQYAEKEGPEGAHI